MSKRKYVAIGGIAVGAVLLSTLLYTALANHGSITASLQVVPDGLSPGGTCQVVCNTTTRDGSALSYSWSASAGEIAGMGAMVTWTAPQSPGPYEISVVVTDTRGDKATAYRTVTVNSPPTIISLIASANWSTPLGSIALNCTARDADNDALSYQWTADGGNITGTGASVDWTAPEEIGTYNITVVVGDGHGGEDVRMKTISVGFCGRPIIESLTVTPNGNKYLIPDAPAGSGSDYEVYQTKKYDIDCVACGVGEVAYAWSCDGGEISGEGQTITWTAPSTSKSIEVTVTVTVSDATGESVSDEIVFYVSYCTCPF